MLVLLTDAILYNIWSGKVIQAEDKYGDTAFSNMLVRVYHQNYSNNLSSVGKPSQCTRSGSDPHREMRELR